MGKTALILGGGAPNATLMSGALRRSRKPACIST